MPRLFIERCKFKFYKKKHLKNKKYQSLTTWKKWENFLNPIFIFIYTSMFEVMFTWLVWNLEHRKFQYRRISLKNSLPSYDLKLSIFNDEILIILRCILIDYGLFDSLILPCWDAVFFVFFLIKLLLSLSRAVLLDSKWQKGKKRKRKRNGKNRFLAIWAHPISQYNFVCFLLVLLYVLLCCAVFVHWR
jgi:hypothetical protein